MGAVVVDPSGTVVSESHNRTRELSDPTAHAEVLALRGAAASLGDWRLKGHRLYVTLEPCAMCAGAIVLSRVAAVVFRGPAIRKRACAARSRTSSRTRGSTTAWS